MFEIAAIAVISAAFMLFGYSWLQDAFRMPVKGKGSKGRQKPETGLWFAVVFAVALLVRYFAAAKYFGFDSDMSCFLSWADMVYQDGFKQFYLSNTFTDYPPGYMYILYVIGGIRDIFGIAGNSTVSVLLTKSPAIIADLGTGVLLYRIAQKYFTNNGAAVLSALYLFCPAVILDSAVWGQTDAVFTFGIVLMCYLITEKKLIPSFFVFAVSILIKPQSLILTPVLIFAVIDQVFLEDFQWKKFWTHLGLGVLAILMIGILMTPFGFNEALSQYTDTLESYKYASVNAYNLWALFGLNWAPQTETFLGLAYKTWGTLFIILTVIAAAVVHFRAKNNPSRYYFEGALLVTSMFCLSVRMHERYLFPAMILLLCAYALWPKKELFFLYTGISAFAFLNIAHVGAIYERGLEAKEIVVKAIALGILAVFGYMIYVAATKYNGYVQIKQFWHAKASGGVASKKAIAGETSNQGGKKARCVIKPSAVVSRIVKADLIAMGVITLVYAVVAFVRLGNMAAPHTEYSVVRHREIVLDMGQRKTIAKLWDYLGYENNPEYNIEYADVNPEEEETETGVYEGWTSLYQSVDAEGEPESWDAGSVFCWNETDINVTARYLRITPTEETYSDSILELVLTDPDGNVLKPVNASDYANLFDEQELFEGRASAMNGTYFDEIYHGRTAYEMIHHLDCYENTHPPLGKIFIAAGVLLFGMNPFGWRFMGTLFGVLMVPIIYLFAKRFFGKTWICVVTTLLFSFDFMHFVQTRIATIDVFVTLFIMLSYYFMYRYLQKSFYDTALERTFIPLGLCGVAMGFSWACKWTGIYASAGLCVLFFWQMFQRYREYRYAKKDPRGVSEGISHRYILENFIPMFWKTIAFCCVFFLIVPALIYLWSYLPFLDGTDRGLFAKVIEAQKTMFHYHYSLNDEHPYSSTWYQWPIMYRPIWYYSGEIGNLREGISAFGNPLVWWAGIPASLYMVYLLAKERDGKAGFLLVGYLSQYAPWFLVSRVVFIYHYFPSVPFITMTLGYSFYRLANWKPSQEKGWRRAVYVYTAVAIGLFILFYPVLSGLAIEPEFATKYLKWFKSWVLLDTWS